MKIELLVSDFKLRCFLRTDARTQQREHRAGWVGHSSTQGRKAGRQAGRQQRCRQTYRFVVPFEWFHAGCTITYSPSLMDATGSFVSACEQHRQERARYECAVRGIDRPTTEHRAPIDQPPNTVHRTWIFMSAQIHEPTEDCGVVATVLKAV